MLKDPVLNETDREYARRALALADEPLISPHPNPRVGCVIVKNRQIIGEGYHAKAGAPHAEINALDHCTDICEGATMYVTLEPCSITGRTPPCADRIIESKIGRVVACTLDPNPKINGTGIERLRNAGIEADVGILEPEAEELNKGFFKRQRQGLPWIAIKIAMSLDGRIAVKSGQSKWITSKASRQDVQRLRARAAGLLTGIGTVAADDPRLDCRIPGAESSLIRIVADSALRISPQAAMFRCAGDILIFAEEGIDAKRRSALPEQAKVVEVPSDHTGLSCRHMMAVLADQFEVNEVLVEAGPGLAGSLLEQRLADEMMIYMSPSLLGHEARPMAEISGIERLADRIQGDIFDVRHIGSDLRVTVRIN